MSAVIARQIALMLLVGGFALQAYAGWQDGRFWWPLIVFVVAVLALVELVFGPWRD